MSLVQRRLKMADELEQIELGFEERLEEINNWLKSGGYEKFKEARRLAEEESLEDPETDPFKSKYKARRILLDLKAELASLLDDEIPSEKAKILKAALDYQIGQNYIETEELSTGEELFKNCINTLAEYRMDKRSCSIHLHALNELGILWSKRGDSEKALGFLQDAEKLYYSYKKEVEGCSPYDIQELFYPEDNFLSDAERERAFSTTFTHTLYYLAQVNAALGHSKKGAMYCHTTLHRQLETEQYDPVDWALNCATLSQYYITQEKYALARHCLACSSRVFSEAEETATVEAVSEDDSQEERERKERIPQRKADISRCWSKYCLDVLRTSRDRCVQELTSADQNDEEQKTEKVTSDESARKEESTQEGDTGEPLRFKSLEVISLEQSVPDHLIKSYDEARVLFLEGQKWLNISKQFYVLDGHVTNHIEIIQDLSQLYKLLSFFDEDFERRCKMHKRRVDMLSEVLIELNPQHYLLVCRQLMFEIAEAYSDMADLKIAIVDESGGHPNAHAVKKINTLINQSIKFFKSFIDSMKNKGALPETFAEDTVRPALVAHFYVARLYSKLICSDKHLKVDNLKKSLAIYQYLVGYCDSHPGVSDMAFKQEIGVSREMAQLLPFKMDKIMKSES